MSFLDDQLRLPPAGNRSAYNCVHTAHPLTEVGCGFVRRPYTGVPQHEQTNSGHYGLIYILRGQGHVTPVHGIRQSVGPGHAMQILPDQKPLYIEPHPDKPWVEAFVALDFLAMDRFATLTYIDLFQPVLHPGLLRSMVRALSKMIDDLTDCPNAAMPGMLLRAQMLVLEFHRCDAKRLGQSHHAEIVEKARVLLDADLHQRCDINQVARVLGLDYHRFRRLFAQATGISPGQYRIQRRIAHARRLLIQQHMGVSEVARALGYPDAFVFSRQFKRFTGLTPSQMRRVK